MSQLWIELRGGNDLWLFPPLYLACPVIARSGRPDTQCNEITKGINWGKPITFSLSPEGDTQKFTTIEQAYHWLLKKWPVADHYRDLALEQADAAMHCLTTVCAAREAFIAAAETAGFNLNHAGARAETAT